MCPTASGAAVALESARPGDVDTDLLFVPIFEGENPVTAVPGVDEAAGGTVRRAAESNEFQGRVYDLFLTPLGKDWRATRLALIGAGKPADFNTERLRKIATAAGLAARQRHVRRLAFVNRGGGEPAAAVQAITEGLVLASFSGDSYKSGERCGPPVEQSLVVSGETGDRTLEASVERGRVMGESCNLARDLSNEPSNVLTPSVFADRGATIARDAGLHVEVLDEGKIARLQMGLLLGVRGGASSRRGCWSCGTRRPAPRRSRCSVWSGRASPSTPAASRSSRPKAWSG